MLARLCALPGPSGFEERVTAAAAELLRPLVDQVYFTCPGSVVGVRRCDRENAPRLLLDAHLDEIGLIVTGHEEGFLRFAPLGGVDPRMLPDREVTILTDPPVHGVVACLPPHVQTAEDMDKSLPIKDLYIDVGLPQEEAEKRIPIGTPATYRGGCAPLGEHLLCGKALDDRCGFAVLLDVLERLQGKELDVDLYVLGSTQEETHSTGAVTAAYELAPAMCVAVDVTHGDSPDASKNETFQLGGGPVIGVGPNCAKSMSGSLKALAKRLDMPAQIEVMSGSSGTNAWPIQVSREGVATAVLSIPERYMHTPVEVVSKKDLEDTAKLLAAFVERCGEEDKPC
ncbi:MAG: M42 family metallopeptidase [Lawsonibacter sp.]|nr:M42 family metallopeptidase [Lawsonibacter sp.]